MEDNSSFISETLIETLTKQFYDWERRGRGWYVFDVPIEIEPPYEPFYHHYASSQQVPDDGRYQSLVVRAIKKIVHFIAPPDPEISEPDEPYSCLARSSPSVEESDISEICITLPPDTEISRAASEQFLNGLRYSQPLSFEIIGLSDSIFIQITCRKEDSRSIQNQLRAYFTDALLSEESNLISRLWNNNKETIMVDFGLSREFMLPLCTFKDFKYDPLIGITGALADLRPDEFSLLQVLFKAVSNPWEESIMRAVSDWQGRKFFIDAPQMYPLSKEKVSRPLFATVIRMVIQSPDEKRAWEIAKSLGGVLGQFANPASNEFIPLNNDGYDELDHMEDILKRQSRRCGMILNSEELVSLVHLPSASVSIPNLKRRTQRSKAAPSLFEGHQLVLGTNLHEGEERQVTLSSKQRIRHTYVIGISGTGKSTLILNSIIQDIKNGKGIGVLDPHGDLIDKILGHIPEEREKDVILFDPSDEEYPVGFNILSSRSEAEKNLLASDLVAVFRRLATSWGDQMTSVLGNAILAFLESRKGGTLADLRRFLVEKDYRRSFLETVEDQEVVYYWIKEYPLLSGRPQASILTRLDSFLRPKLIRHMVCQKENRIDFEKIMNGQKIFLAKLAQGIIGNENSYLLGTLLVSAIHQSALSRQNIKESERKNFYLYIDEFQNFITPSMAAILSGVRKYHLGLILAHQELQQLLEKGKEVASAVLSNPCTRICFQVGDFDAKKLEQGFSFFEAKDLQNLDVGEAIVRIEKAEHDFNLKTLPPPKVEANLAEERRAKIISYCRKTYGVEKAKIEKILAEARKPLFTYKPVEKIKKRLKKDQEEMVLSEVEKSLLKTVAEKPYQEKEDIGKDLGVSDETLKKMMDSLESKKLVDVAGDKEDKKSPIVPTTKGAKLAGCTPPLGRGGAQYKYLQHLIKKVGEEKGYRATIEKQVKDGQVDLVLETNERRIACEIALSTTIEQELGNIKKCIAANFNQVFVLSPDKKNLKKIEAIAVKKLSASDLEKVSFMLPEDFIDFFEKEEADALSKEETIHGYKVKVKYTALSEDQKKAKHEALSKVILQAMKRLKGKN